jgi:hypothetical protein
MADIVEKLILRRPSEILEAADGAIGKRARSLPRIALIA